MSRAATLDRPRPARRAPARGASRPSGVHLPVAPRQVRRALARIAAAALLVGLILAALALRLPERVGLAVTDGTAASGLEVRHVEVAGTRHLSRAAVLDAAFHGEQSSAILAIDLAAMQGRIESLAWVEQATVARRLPDRIEIAVVERKPAAIWQLNRRLAVIDSTGHVLTPADPRKFAGLPLVLGEGANLEMASLDALLATQPLVRKEVASARWIGGRRWDLDMLSGELLMLPEGYGAAQRALAEFARLDATQALLGRGYARFDLRLPDKMVVRLKGDPDVEAAEGTPI